MHKPIEENVLHSLPGMRHANNQANLLLVMKMHYDLYAGNKQIHEEAYDEQRRIESIRNCVRDPILAPYENP